jgi:MFS family permease
LHGEAVATIAHPRLLDRTVRALTFGSVALVSLGAFETIAVATAMPTAAAALHDVAGYALAFGLPLATSVVGMVVAGTWSDARGPAAAMRTGVLLFVGGLVLAGLATTVPVLAVGRGVQGFGSGLFSVALYVVVGRAVVPELRPRMFAAFAAAWVLPSVVGPPLAGLIVEQAGWRWVFLLAAALAVPAAALVEPALRGLGGPVGEALPRRHLARIGWAAGAAAGAAGLNAAGQLPGAAAAVIGLAALAAVLVSAPRLFPAGTGVARPGLPAVIAVRAGWRPPRSSAARCSCHCCSRASGASRPSSAGWCSPRRP